MWLIDDDRPQDADTAAEQSEREDRVQAAEAAFEQDIAMLETDEVAGTDTQPAAHFAAAQTSRTLDDSTSDIHFAVAAEAQSAGRASHGIVDSGDGAREDPCVVTTTEPGPLEQGLLMALHDPVQEAAPVVADTGELPVLESISPPGRTSASDLIAAMVRQAEEQEAAARLLLDVAAGSDAATAEEHTDASRPTVLRSNAVWTDVGLDEASIVGRPQFEYNSSQQSAHEQSSAGMLCDD